MIIQHNMASMFAHRQLGITTNTKAKSAEKLSSGYRINRAADDAAGLAISEKMRRQIRGLGQNMLNIQDGISFIQVADGYLNEVHDMLQRINELSVKGANGTLTDKDREFVNEEVQQIKNEIERVFGSASFNEMKIFKVPYAPSVTPNEEPYDIQVFYSAPGTIGGLDFNNVRYNLDELAAKGLELDGNGNSTKDQTVEFDLWDGEKVHISLKEGESLDKVVRKYEWKADETGIKVNNVDVATWAGLGISGNGTDAGTYSFDYHGTTVSFDVEEGDDLSSIIEGINGNSITEPSYWNISASSATSKRIFTLPNGVNSVTVTNANKNVADDKYEILATTEGLSVRRTDRNDSTETSTTGVTSWGSFKNISSNPVPRTPAESTDYPISNWGLENDSNDSSSITFDSDAKYNYNKTLDNVSINYNFKLTDVSSRDEVISAINETNLGGSVTPGNSSLTNENKLGFSISNNNKNISANNYNAFVLQRAYGRNFDQNGSSITGEISWASTKTNETEHELRTGTPRPISSNTTYSDPTSYYYQTDDGKVYLRSNEMTVTRTDNMQRVDTYTWREDYNVAFSGSLGDSTMDGETRNISSNYTQTKTYNYTVKSYTFSYSSDRLITGAELDELRQRVDEGNAIIENGAHQIPAGESTTPTLASDTTSHTSGTLSLSSSYVDNSKSNLSAFDYRYDVSYNDIINKAGAAKGDSVSLNLTFNQNATRSFNPSLRGNSVNEYDFMNIVIVPPRKEMIIQATPDGVLGEQIPINWSALSLSIIGMTGANTLTQEASQGSIDLTKAALDKISLERSGFGAAQNRLEHAYNYTANAQENTQHSESIIRDTDMNAEITRLRNHEVLQQAGEAMLAQANQSKQGVLSLLQ
ncbi:hypothetical protein D6856_08180 [Butyrivibrio sp. XB500-5]|uniref:flagellin N-terminal helical domain-containing protein n=1 Tax=Butyrivibrio sp. XB500-5 TaxID=2364880 RepID=UPI000EAA7339|nr:flagellin [Butyrivibrio sp. XB500-5]RKM60052.1 hypothetical protein D6856_08180 [Butyrivibrio sp. XB500-5]